MSAVPLSPSQGAPVLLLRIPIPRAVPGPAGSPSLECCAQQLFPVGLESSSAPQEWFGATNALFSCWLGDVVQVGGDFFFFFFLVLLPILGSLCIYIYIFCSVPVWENGLPSLYTLPTM